MTHQTPDEIISDLQQRLDMALDQMAEAQDRHAAAEARVQAVERERDDLRRLKNTLQEQLEAAESRSLATEREANREHDALDLKAGHGPTALSMVAADRDALRERLVALESALRVAIEEIDGDYWAGDVNVLCAALSPKEPG